MRLCQPLKDIICEQLFLLWYSTRKMICECDAECVLLVIAVPCCMCCGRDDVHAAFINSNGIRSIGEENKKTCCQIGKGYGLSVFTELGLSFKSCSIY